MSMRGVFVGGRALRQLLSEIKRKTGTKKEVRAGVIGNETYPDGTPVKVIAALMEYGFARTYSNGNTVFTPPRPAMRLAVANNQKAWARLVRDGLANSNYNVDAVLDNLGARMVEDIQTSILDFNDPPNAPSTVKRKGFNDPLIDSGRYFDSISYRVQNGD